LWRSIRTGRGGGAGLFRGCRGGDPPTYHGLNPGTPAAILKLRALTTNGDLDQYWTWHLTQEQQRIHNVRCLSGVTLQ
jgi:hypothetical protein